MYQQQNIETNKTKNKKKTTMKRKIQEEEEENIFILDVEKQIIILELFIRYSHGWLKMRNISEYYSLDGNELLCQYFEAISEKILKIWKLCWNAKYKY